MKHRLPMEARTVAEEPTGHAYRGWRITRALDDRHTCIGHVLRKPGRAALYVEMWNLGAVRRHITSLERG